MTTTMMMMMMMMIRDSGGDDDDDDDDDDNNDDDGDGEDDDDDNNDDDDDGEDDDDDDDDGDDWEYCKIAPRTARKYSLHDADVESSAMSPSNHGMTSTAERIDQQKQVPLVVLRGDHHPDARHRAAQVQLGDRVQSHHHALLEAALHDPLEQLRGGLLRRRRLREAQQDDGGQLIRLRAEHSQVCTEHSIAPNASFIQQVQQTERTGGSRASGVIHGRSLGHPQVWRGFSPVRDLERIPLRAAALFCSATSASWPWSDMYSSAPMPAVARKGGRDAEKQ